MKVLVTGVGGQLGYDVINELNKRGHKAIGSDILPKENIKLDCEYIQLDITNADEVRKVITELSPDAVIHCAAWTAVDAAEDEENIPKVFAINADGTKHIAEACKEVDCKMLYISTDYVFDGQGTTPWQADCKDYAPLNVYGKSKLQGELAVAETLEKYFIVRIAWVFGKNGNNFIKTMLNVGKKFDTLRVVNDQIGTPTYTFDLARLLVDMIETKKYGYYHATNEGGYISWYDFACEIFKQANLLTPSVTCGDSSPKGAEEESRPIEGKPKLVPVTTEEYGLSKAVRPYNSRLDRRKLVQEGFTPLPDWKDAVGRYLKEIEF